jgi:hypothetical protein
VSTERTKAQDRDVAQLSGLRRAIYYAAISRGKGHEDALRLASARCCTATSGHAPSCENAVEEWDK